MNQTLTLSFLIAAGIGLVGAKYLDGTHRADILDDPHRHVT